MDTKNAQEDVEFSFIQEKVVPRRKNKVKRMMFTTVFTLLLAAAFGFVARVVFIKSEGFINRLLGIDTTKRSQIFIPTNNPEGSGGDKQPDISAAVSVSPTLTPIVTPTAQLTPDPEDTKESVQVVEKIIEATIADYERMLFDIRKMANTASNSLATVTAVESKEDWLEEFYESRHSTTGIVIGENNAELLILTTLDQIKNADILEISFNAGFTIEGQLWNYDKDYNLAVIAVKLKDIPPVQLSSIKTATLGESYALTLGSAIVALGQPNGNKGSMELGFITGKGDSYYITDNRLDIFTTDITNNENSAGVILDMQGQIIGLITQNLSDGSLNSVSTAIGISRLKPIIEKLANKVERIYFGITGEDIPSEVLEDYGLNNGLYITKVVQDSPAFISGVKPGDIITGINEYTVSSVTNFVSIINNCEVGTVVNVSIQRQSKGEWKEVVLEITLDKKE